MTNKQAVTAAVIFYLLLIAIGGATYFFLPQIKAAIPALAGRSAAAEALLERQRREAERKAAQAAEEEKRRAEEAERAAAEKAAREQERAAREQREEQIDQLAAGMKETVRNGVTIYTYPSEGQMGSGVHLRPFILRGYDGATLKNEIYYYYSIYDNSPTNWVHGDGLNVQADGQSFALYLDATKRHDHLSSDAESLTERYVMTADQQTLDILHAVAAAGSVTLYYYQSGGVGCSSTLSREELRHIRAMVQLYDLLSQQYGSAEG